MVRRRSNNKTPGQRQLRMGEQIRHVLAEILRDGKLRDPDLTEPSLVTVTAVEMGPDLAHAHAYVMPLGGKDIKKVLDALNRAAGYFRSELGHRLELRHTPKISFYYDKSFDESAKISALLKKTQTETE